MPFPGILGTDCVPTGRFHHVRCWTGSWRLVPARTEGGPVTGGETIVAGGVPARRRPAVPTNQSMQPSLAAQARALIGGLWLLAHVSWRLLLGPAWRSLPKLTARKQVS